MTRFAFVVSTSGSVMNETLRSDYLRSLVHSVVVDRECEAITKARNHSVPVRLFNGKSNDEFCERLLTYLSDNDIEYVISFYTNFYSDEIRDAYRDRLINFHPSLLPAFKGMDGFGDGLAYRVKFIGTTVELIKDRMDEGKIVMQTACPVDRSQGADALRHRIFVQQCKTLLQVAKWIDDDRLHVHGDEVIVDGTRFDSWEFAPALDFAEAISFDVPPPYRN